MMEEEKKKQNSDRAGKFLVLAYQILLAFSVVVLVKIVLLQTNYHPDPAIERASTQSSTKRTLEPHRGGILSDNGSPLAISVPIYTIHMDCTVKRDFYAAMSDKAKGARKEAVWVGKAKELAEGLAAILKEKNATEYYDEIISGRRSGKKYLPICKDVDHACYMKLKDLPLFNEKQMDGGMIVDRKNIRLHPYGKLAYRTIGFVRDSKSGITNTHVGLEGRFDYALHGKDGEIWMKEVDLKEKVRDYRKPYRPAEDGCDIRTTLNIDIQDIADAALRSQIEEDPEIEGGCCVIMDVKTGAIKAMVNLLRDEENGQLEESYNLAIGRSGEPGSVFKTITLMTLMEDGYIRSMDDRIPTNGGIFMDFDVDNHILNYEREHNSKTIPIIEGFKVSSNYMFQYLAWEYYSDQPSRYIDKLYTYKLGEAFDFDLKGLATPQIASPGAKGWGNTSLPSVAFGYSTAETPLHILTVYNAIANKGKMMRPYLVEDVVSGRKVVEERGPGILNAAICSKATADTLVRALKSVVEEGTAKRLKGTEVQVCGKTGTSRALIPGIGFEDSEGRKKNQGTFVGFFPADDPQYSVIAVVYSVFSHKNAYGGDYPAGAVKHIVNEMYHTGKIKLK